VGFTRSVAEGSVEYLDKQRKAALQEATEPVITLDLEIPAIPEYVHHYACDRELSYLDAALVLRDSKNAKAFRKWCAMLTARRDAGRDAQAEVATSIVKMRKAVSAWCDDVEDRVGHAQRRIKLEDVPYLGKVLKAFGLSEWRLRDPVLWVDRDTLPLLFLNDLLRRPKAPAIKTH
jgi:hypothetical protein